ncbi:MAG: choice-of-anchor V domain-containing protein [Chitinophagales bacterium]
MIKNILLFSCACLITLGIISFSLDTAHSNGAGAPTGNTGSPADNKTCAQVACHPGPATPISEVFTSDVPETGYVAGSTYTITATVSDPALVKFGFQISPQNTAGTLLGTLALVDADKTKFTSSANKYITHKSTGTSFPSHSASWSFAWTAPATGTGDVTFYGAFNFTNNNNNSTGDVIHTSTLTVSESLEAGINEEIDLASLNIYPNPVADQLHLTYYLSNQQPVTISLLNLSGSRITVLTNETQQAGSYNPSFSFDEFATGVYVLELKAGTQSFLRKVVKL